MGEEEWREGECERILNILIGMINVIDEYRRLSISIKFSYII